MLLEVPVFSPAAARIAVQHGAGRLELNRAGSYAVGGLTPSRAEVEAVAADLLAGDHSAIPLRIMIRPRGPPDEELDNNSPDFVYTSAEIDGMCNDMAELAGSGLLDATRGDGFVFGVVEQEEDKGSTERGRQGGGRLHLDHLKRLVAAAGPYACVFHRAFDKLAVEEQTCDEALDHLGRELGFRGLLTAGGPGPGGAAARATTTLRRMALHLKRQEVSGRPRLELIVGGGVRSSNVVKTVRDMDIEGPLQGIAFHSACLDAYAASTQGTAGEMVDGEEVARLVQALADISHS